MVATQNKAVFDAKLKLQQAERDQPALPDARAWSNPAILRKVFKELGANGSFNTSAGLFHGHSLSQCTDAILACAHAILCRQNAFVTQRVDEGGETVVVGWSFDATPQPVSFQEASTVIFKRGCGCDCDVLLADLCACVCAGCGWLESHGWTY